MVASEHPGCHVLPEELPPYDGEPLQGFLKQEMFQRGAIPSHLATMSCSFALTNNNYSLRQREPKTPNEVNEEDEEDLQGEAVLEGEARR